MRYLPALAAVCLLIVPSVALAQQISPNPNPAGNTITVNTNDAYNADDFKNSGDIGITLGGRLTNNVGGTLDNLGGLINEGTLVSLFRCYFYCKNDLGIDLQNSDAILDNGHNCC